MQIKDLIPPIAYRLASRLRLGQYGWFGDFPTWADAEKSSTGYDADTILQKVKDALLKVKSGEAAFERDSVLFDKIEYSWPLLSGLMWAAAQFKGELRVIDFGGSLGSTYFQNRKFLKDLPRVQWDVVEQAQFVECGNRYFASEELKFYNDFEDCFDRQSPQVILFSCVLQYLAKPFDVIKQVMQFNPKFIIVDNMPFLKTGKPRITVQKVDPSIYLASYPCWMLDRAAFLDAFRTYELIESFESPLSIRLDGDIIHYEGFIFKAKE